MQNLTAHLVAYPRTDWDGGLVAVAASCGFRGGSGLTFQYRVTGAIDDLRLPTPRVPRRADDLWRHTCFEAFVAVNDVDYLEFNFSPSGEWAAYAFAGYRAPAPEPMLAAPRIECVAAAGEIVLTATVADTAVITAAGPRCVAVGLTAVLETEHGALGYFAAHHPAERPDFHDRRGFILSIDTAGASP